VIHEFQVIKIDKQRINDDRKLAEFNVSNFLIKQYFFDNHLLDLEVNTLTI